MIVFRCSSFWFPIIRYRVRYVVAAATSAGLATSRTLLLIGELKVVPAQQSGCIMLKYFSVAADLYNLKREM